MVEVQDLLPKLLRERLEVVAGPAVDARVKHDVRGALRDELSRPRRPLLHHDRHQVGERELEAREAQLAGELVVLVGLHVAEGLDEKATKFV